MMSLDIFWRRKWTPALSCSPQAAPPRANWPHSTSLLPFHAASGTLSLGKMVAGNGLFVPQRQFIPGASHPLLRSEECLGKRAAGIWLSFALECDRRAAFKPHSPSSCQQETARAALRINSEEYRNTLPQNTGDPTNYCMWAPRKSRESENTGALPCCPRITPWMRFQTEGPQIGTSQP